MGRLDFGGFGCYDGDSVGFSFVYREWDMEVSDSGRVVVIWLDFYFERSFFGGYRRGEFGVR